MRTAHYAGMTSGIGGFDARTWSASDAPASRPPVLRMTAQRMSACGFDGIKLNNKATVRPEGLLGGSTG